MTLHADALACNLATRLGACSHDELRVLDVVLGRLEKGRVDYGPLELDGDPRVWRDEAAEELVDLAIYDACDRLARRDADRAELHAAAAAEISSTRAAGGNADRLPRVAARVDTSSVERGLAELADNAPEDDTWERRRFDVSDTGGES